MSVLRIFAAHLINNNLPTFIAKEKIKKERYVYPKL
jgi:hypothetical protein